MSLRPNNTPETVAIMLFLLLLVSSVLGYSDTQETVYNYVEQMKISPSMQESLVDSLRRAFTEGIADEDKTLTALKWIDEREADIAEKEGLLNILVDSIDQGLPANQLLNELSEGLARGVSMSEVRRVLLRWKNALAEVKRLLGRAGIGIGTPLEGGETVSRSELYVAIENITHSVEQFLLEARNPHEEQADELKDRTLHVLNQDFRLSFALINLIDKKVSSGQLIEVANSLA